MDVIFLDIDGVLNCKRTPNPRKLPYIVDPLLLKRFKQLVDRVGAEVVLSSIWRYDPARKRAYVPSIHVFCRTRSKTWMAPKLGLTRVLHY